MDFLPVLAIPANIGQQEINESRIARYPAGVGRVQNSKAMDHKTNYIDSRIMCLSYFKMLPKYRNLLIQSTN